MAASCDQALNLEAGLHVPACVEFNSSNRQQIKESWKNDHRHHKKKRLNENRIVSEFPGKSDRGPLLLKRAVLPQVQCWGSRQTSLQLSAFLLNNSLEEDLVQEVR